MFQKWSHGEKVRCPQTKIGQGGWAPKGRRGWRGNWAFSRISAELSWAEATALWGTGGAVFCSIKGRNCSEKELIRVS